MRATSIFFFAVISLAFGQEKSRVLYKAISSNDTTRVMEIVKDSSEANLVFSQGPWMKISMLIAAVNQGNATNVKHLLRNGADPNWRDGFKSTAIMYAAHQGDLSIVKLLVEYGADIAYQDEQGNSALSSAKEAHKDDVIKFLESELAASAPPPDTLTQGLDFLQCGNEEAALQLLLPLAEKGEMQAEFALGLIYDSEEGIPRDAARAAEWYRRAGSHGHPGGQLYYAVLLQQGDGVEKNTALAAALYKEVIEKPDVAGTQPQAALQLAGLYRSGEGVEKNATKAVELYQMAAKRRNYVAMYELAEMYFSGDGIEKNPLVAVQYARLAASVAPGPQVCLMARLLREYAHLTTDKKELYVWSRLAEEAGDCEAADAKAAKKNLSAEEVQEADNLVKSMREMWQIMSGRGK